MLVIQWWRCFIIFILESLRTFFFSNQAEKWKWLDEGRGELRLDDPRIRIAYYFENGKREKKKHKVLAHRPMI
jgi:hypothetical protein